MKHSTTEAQVGDLLEAHRIHGEQTRRGEIVEVLGGPGRQHYRVRWDERHESIVYPADGVTVVRRSSAAAGRRAR
jgi:Domain of unknown function (DUF1918)